VKPDRPVSRVLGTAKQELNPRESNARILEFNVKDIPFSRKGSYLAISILKPGPAAKGGLYLRHLRGGGKGPAFLIEPIMNGEPAPYTVRATPHVLSLRIEGESNRCCGNTGKPADHGNNTAHGLAEFCFPTPQTLHFRITGQGLGLRFTMATGSYDHVTPVCPIRNAMSNPAGSQDLCGDHEIPATAWEVNSYTHGVRFLLTSLRGKLKVHAPWKGLNCEYIKASFLPEQVPENTRERISEQALGKLPEKMPGTTHRTIAGTMADTMNGTTPGIMAEGFLQEYVVAREPAGTVADFRENVECVRKDFEDWLYHCPDPLGPESLPALQEAHCRKTRGHMLASYITWSCMVRKEGFLPRPAMYMSKNWMANIWSWDHCFNAMAQIYKNPALAWDQFCIFFDRQHQTGVLPDYMNNRYATWNCCKPPVHGWALNWMMERDASGYISDERLSEVYLPLARWTEWWFRFRDDDRDGIPQYDHGNDSGWDNSTVFSQGVPVESPDLSAFLVIQMETLAGIARRLGKTQESITWLARSEDLLNKMIAHFWNWNRKQFVPTLLTPSCEPCDHRHGACLRHSHHEIQSASLLPYVSIVLGKRLPESIRQCLVNDLAAPGKFLTEFGLATESVSSPHYNSDGYWRGPIWAPATMLIVEGLYRAGEESLARDIARRFCKMASENGMAENFDALSGKGLQDRAFTWTSSVYMILAHEYL